MLVNMRDILADARKNKYAIGCIYTTTVDILRAVVAAAEELNTPLIIDHAQVHNSLIPLEYIAPHMIECAKKASVPICVHLDHGKDYNFIMQAIRQGFTSIMYDCSSLSFEENAANLKDFTKIAHDLDITVEAELGVMISTENDSHSEDTVLTNADIRKYFTDPDEAGKFVEITGVDALAVCFGTMHGIYAEDPVLDIELLRAIKSKIGDTSIVMHGGSGVAMDQIKAAITEGCSKINYYSYMAKSASESAKRILDASDKPVIYHELTEQVVVEIKDYAKNILHAFRNGY